MPDPSPKLRIVGEGEPPPRRRRGPGLAVILVALYGLTFAAALWLMRGPALRGGRPQPRSSDPPIAAAGAPATRDQKGLLSGAGLEPGALHEYARQLAADCCDCGCDLTLHECLVGDQKCARSAQMAEDRLGWLR